VADQKLCDSSNLIITEHFRNEIRRRDDVITRAVIKRNCIVHWAYCEDESVLCRHRHRDIVDVYVEVDKSLRAQAEASVPASPKSSSFITSLRIAIVFVIFDITLEKCIMFILRPIFSSLHLISPGDLSSASDSFY